MRIRLRNQILAANIALCEYDYQPKDGYYSVPDLPGIGQELTEKTIAESEIVTLTKNRWA